MKYAFLIGSNAFIVPSNTISYGETESGKHFLRVNAIHNDSKGSEPSSLNIDLEIKDTDGTSVVVIANKPVTGAPYTIKTDRDSIQILRSDGSMIIHVHQLDTEAAMALEHNIVAELEVNDPVVVIRITGEFFVDHMLVKAQNEKLFINDNGYATSAMVGHNDLRFTSNGVVI